MTLFELKLEHFKVNNPDATSRELEIFKAGWDAKLKLDGHKCEYTKDPENSASFINCKIWKQNDKGCTFCIYNEWDLSKD